MAALTAWTTLDPYTREEKTSNSTKGAAIGAAADRQLNRRVEITIVPLTDD